MRHYRRNADERIRSLERAALSEGTPEAGWRLLLEYRRAGWDGPEYEDLPHYVIEDARGDLEVAPSIGWIMISNDDKHSDGWSHGGRRVWLSFFYNLTKAGHLRLDRGYVMSGPRGSRRRTRVSNEAYQSVEKEVRKLLKAWVRTYPGLVAGGDLAARDEIIQEKLVKIDRMEEDLAAVRREAGAAFLERVAFSRRAGL